MRRTSTVLAVKRQHRNSETNALIASATSRAVAMGLFFINKGRNFTDKSRPLSNAFSGIDLPHEIQDSWKHRLARFGYRHRHLATGWRMGTKLFAGRRRRDLR